MYFNSNCRVHVPPPSLPLHQFPNSNLFLPTMKVEVGMRSNSNCQKRACPIFPPFVHFQIIDSPKPFSHPAASPHHAIEPGAKSGDRTYPARISLSGDTPSRSRPAGTPPPGAA